jgi:hypothetical protein
MTRSNKVVNGLRSYLRNLSQRRSNSYVTADDAHVYLSRQGVGERKIRTRLSYINSVLRRPNFRPVGETNSEREAARSRVITVWTAR